VTRVDRFKPAGHPTDGFLVEQNPRSGPRVPITVKVQGAVLAGVVALLAVAVAGVAAVGRVNDDAEGLYAGGVRPAQTLTDLRDMQGDSRVAARDYVLAEDAAARADVRKEISVADEQLDADIEAYLATPAAYLDGGRRDLMEQFQEKLVAWRQVRDTQLLPVVDRGDRAAAIELLHGAFDQANEAMGQPMDDLFVKEDEAASASAAHARATYSRNRAILLLVALVGAGGALLLGWFVARGISRPVRSVAAVLEHLGEGDLRHRVEVRSRDEIAAMAGQLNRSMDRLSGLVQAVSSESATVTTAAERVGGLSSDLTRTAAETDEVVTSANAAGRRVGEESGSVTAAATSMDAVIADMTRSVERSAEVTLSAVAAATESSRSVEALRQAAEGIGGVAQVITAIAEQTNLLALNATIEAARAGDAGKGFAVVANEVKDLAQQTARATEDIADRLERMQASTDAAVANIEQIHTVISDVDRTQARIADAVKEQSGTTAEIGDSARTSAAGAHEIQTSIDAIAQGTRATSEASATLGTASQELAASASRLRTAASAFQW
jgi:methyl-accepting chemotaxis protein